MVCDVVPRRHVPALLLSDTALALLRDVFARPALFTCAHRIAHRTVYWGSGKTVTMPHSAVVVSESDLARELGDELIAPLDSAASVDFEVRAIPVEDEDNPLQCFGHRPAQAVPVALTDVADRSTCYVEAVVDGWLFLLPSGPEDCWLLAIGGPVDLLVSQSVLVAPLLVWRGDPSSTFETAPRISSRLAGQGWLACGTAAVAFDPICGDGTAQAVREGILAAAVIGALREDGEPAALYEHYQSMLTASLRRHLQISGQFYSTGGNSAWWRAQLAAVASGYEWCTQQLASVPEPQFVLRGDRLARRELHR